MQSNLAVCTYGECEDLPSIREWCQRHYNKLYRDGELPEKKKTIKDVDVEGMTVTCDMHGKSRLRIRHRKSGAVYYACRACERGSWEEPKESRNARNRQWRKENPDKVRASNRRSRVKAHRERFGWSDFFTQDDYERLLNMQSGGCAICGSRPSRDKHLAIDHDHESGQVRGLLCTVCNWAIGRFRDNPDRFESAADYLRQARA